MVTAHRLTLTFLVLVAVALPALAGSLRLSGDRLFVPAAINGVAVEALLDSGAEITLLDAAFAKRLGLELTGSETARGTGGEQEVRFAEGVTIESAGTRLHRRRVAVLDLSDISRRLVGEPVRVIVGRELFDAGRFVLDFQAGRFAPAPADHVPAGVELPLTDHAGIEQLPVIIEGVATRADFDLGNGSDVLIGRSFAAARGLLAPGRVLGRQSGGGIGGAVSREVVELRSLTLGGITFTGVPAAIDATGHAADANVGVKLLRHFRATIDFPGETVWLEPVDPPPTGAARNLRSPWPPPRRTSPRRAAPPGKA